MKMKGKFYMSEVRLTTLYGLECWKVEKNRAEDDCSRNVNG